MLTLPVSTVARQRYSDEASAKQAAETLAQRVLIVTGKQTRIMEEAPPRPYTTLELIEDAAQLLGWSSRKTMAEAQILFEQGYITYPRSDSTYLAPEAIQALRAVVAALYGRNALGKRPSGVDRAEKAHEAIRPTDPARKPEDLDTPERALYRLIWQRSLASQMRPARYKVIEVTFRVDR